jgi:hypothetical protein
VNESFPVWVNKANGSNSIDATVSQQFVRLETALQISTFFEVLLW